MRLFGKIVLSIPIVGLWADDYITPFALLVLLTILWGACVAMDLSRSSRRTPIYTIFSFMFLTGWVPFGLFIALVGVLSFWEACWAALAAASMGTAVWWLFSWVGYQTIKHQNHVVAWVAAGGHYFWDTLPIWNPDSDLVKAGGFPEPHYTNFVPPREWIFQCPHCHVRLQHNPDVCWNCNYGADNDSTAYYQAHGGSPPPPPTQQPPPQQPQQPPGPPPGYAPIPRR